MFKFALIEGLNLSSHVFVDYLAPLCLELLELIFWAFARRSEEILSYKTQGNT